MLLCNHKELVFPWSKILKRARFHLLKFLTFDKTLKRARFHLLKFLTFEKIFHEFDNHDVMSNKGLKTEYEEFESIIRDVNNFKKQLTEK